MLKHEAMSVTAPQHSPVQQSVYQDFDRCVGRDSDVARVPLVPYRHVMKTHDGLCSRERTGSGALFLRLTRSQRIPVDWLKRGCAKWTGGVPGLPENGPPQKGIDAA